MTEHRRAFRRHRNWPINCSFAITPTISDLTASSPALPTASWVTLRNNVPAWAESVFANEFEEFRAARRQR
jgi:hypothetical protein